MISSNIRITKSIFHLSVAIVGDTDFNVTFTQVLGRKISIELVSPSTFKNIGF